MEVQRKMIDNASLFPNLFRFPRNLLNAQYYASQILQVSYVFNDELEKISSSNVFNDELENISSSDERRIQTWSNQNYRNKLMVVVAQEKDEDRNQEG